MLGQFFLDAGCEFCVKLTRAFLALFIDLIIASGVVLSAKGLALIIGGKDYLDAIHTALAISSLVVYGSYGIWDGIKSMLKPTSPPC